MSLRTPGIKTSAIRGLYAITPDEADTDVLLRKARLALQGGVRLLQYRNKIAGANTRQMQARALRALTREYSAMLIVNDDAQLAKQVDADGVHLGRADETLGAARAILGGQKIIGISCYNQLLQAKAAIAEGADYVAFGAFFPSATKPGAVKAGPELLRQARSECSAPIVAIGGITAQNGAALVEAGADALAVITAVFDAPDIEAAARDFEKLFIRKAAS
ncbi:MAG TPA: thiamine phosphate synthase [Gallionellaceae bacterium]